jgi:MscS family membrane protein
MFVNTRLLLVPATVLALLLSATNVFAQEPVTQAAAEVAAPADDILEDAFDRGTPRRSLVGFLTAAQNRDYEAAAEYLDFRNLPSSAEAFDGPALAHGLAIVIERKLWIDLAELDDSHDGARGDGLPSYRDKFAELETKDGAVILLLQQVPRGDGEFIWKISNRTVAEIPSLYDEFGYGRVEEWLIDFLPDVTILNVELFKWVIVIGTAVIAYPILLLLLRLLSVVIVEKASPVRDSVRHFLTRPFLWLLLVLITNHVTNTLGLGIEAQRLRDAHTVDIAILTWVLLSATNLFRTILRNRMRRQGKEGAIVLLGPVGNAAKMLIVLLAVLLWLSNMGFNITALLAGLGVGGIAIALALQKPLEDLFGAVTMYSQQPARVGDFCRFGEVFGTIEEIGLRTTRIRTLGNTVVSIPNAKIAGDALDNYSARRSIWYHPKLTLRFDSTAEQLREVLTEIREYLISHEKVVEDPCRVRLTGFGKYGIELDVYAYVRTTVWADYLEIAEELNLSIIEIITRSGTEFAVPIQSMATQQ